MPLFVWAALLDCCMEVLRLAWRNDPDLVARWLEYSEKTKVVPNDEAAPTTTTPPNL